MDPSSQDGNSNKAFHMYRTKGSPVCDWCFSKHLMIRDKTNYGPSQDNYKRWTNFQYHLRSCLVFGQCRMFAKIGRVSPIFCVFTTWDRNLIAIFSILFYEGKHSKRCRTHHGCYLFWLYASSRKCLELHLFYLFIFLNKYLCRVSLKGFWDMRSSLDGHVLYVALMLNVQKKGWMRGDV